MFLRFKKTWSVIFILILLILLWNVAELAYKQETGGKVYCIPATRDVEACIEVYQPVCGFPINQTYDNPCFACINKTIEYYIEGECINEK